MGRIMQSEPLLELLLKCIVRISVENKQGTGFFVAPNLILTCAHVVDVAHKINLPVKIYWDNQTYSAQIREHDFFPKPYPDLAILFVELPEHPCVYLHDAVKLKDEIYSYGYINNSKGDSVTFKYEGPTVEIKASSKSEEQADAFKLLKLKDGQVEPGRSGSPLLNLRTGGVCGILKMTRDRHNALGGRAIPTSVIFSRVTNLKSLQQQFHEKDKRWLQCLDDGQKKLLIRQDEDKKDQSPQVPSLRSVGIRPSIKECFIDRGSSINELVHFVGDKSSRLMLIAGPGGFGKTALAAKFCDYIEEAGYILNPISEENDRGIECPIRFIIYVSKNEMMEFSIDQLFEEILQTLEPEIQNHFEQRLKNSKTVDLKTERILQSLKRQEKEECSITLLLLDNFDTVLNHFEITDSDLKSFLKIICTTQHNNLKVIITSRNAIDHKPQGMKLIHIEEGLEVDDAVNALRRLGREVCQIKQAEEGQLRQLAEKVYGIPMALWSLVGFLNQNRHRRLTVAQLLENDRLFENFKEEGLRKLIGEQYRILSEHEAHVLQALSVYNSPVKSEGIQALLPDLEAEDFKTILDDLAFNYLMAQWNEKTEQFKLHPIIQEVVYPSIPEETLYQYHKRAAGFYATLKKLAGEWNRFDDLQPQLRESYHLVQAKTYDKAAHVLLEREEGIENGVIDLLLEWGYSSLVIERLRILLDNISDKSDYYDEIHGCLGFAYENIGLPQNAREHYEQALERAQKDENKNWWKKGLGSCYSDLGENSQAIQHYGECRAFFEDSLNHKAKADILGDLGICYARVGEIDKAFECFNEALGIFHQCKDIKEECTCYVEIGNVLVDQKKFKEAIENYERAICEIPETDGDKYRCIRYKSYRGLSLAYLYSSKENHSNLTEARTSIDKAKQEYPQLKDKSVDSPANLCNTETLFGIIALRQNDVSIAQNAFESAIQYAGHHLKLSDKNYEILDTIGLAYIGLALCNPGKIDDSIIRAKEAFIRARNITKDSGIVNRVLELFDVLDENGIMKEVRETAKEGSVSDEYS